MKAIGCVLAVLVGGAFGCDDTAKGLREDARQLTSPAGAEGDGAGGEAREDPSHEARRRAKEGLDGTKRRIDELERGADSASEDAKRELGELRQEYDALNRELEKLDQKSKQELEEAGRAIEARSKALGRRVKQVAASIERRLDPGDEEPQDRQ